MKKLFLIIGAPGSGKTTDANLVAKARPSEITHYSAGDMFRAEVASGSERGKIIDSFISKGNIVPIEIAIETIVNAIKNAPTDIIIIDGYPRSIEQMQALDTFLKQEPDIALTQVIEVYVGEKTARERVLGRARGSDDNETVFANRMSVYLEPLNAIRTFYQDQEKLSTINAERDIEIIVSDMNDLIKNLV